MVVHDAHEVIEQEGGSGGSSYASTTMPALYTHLILSDGTTIGSHIETVSPYRDHALERFSYFFDTGLETNYTYIPRVDDKNPWEKLFDTGPDFKEPSYFDFDDGAIMGKSFIKKRTALFLNSGWDTDSNGNKSFAAWEYNDAVNIYFVHHSDNTYKLYKTATINANIGSIVFSDELVYDGVPISPCCDRCVITLQGAGGGGSTCWGSCNGSGGGSGGCLFAVLDLTKLKDAHVDGKYTGCYHIRLARGGAGGATSTTAGDPDSGLSGGWSILSWCSYSPAGFNENILGVAVGGGGAQPKKGGGGTPGAAYLNPQYINTYTWELPGMHGSLATCQFFNPYANRTDTFEGYKHGLGAYGGSGGETGSPGEAVNRDGFWVVSAGYNKSHGLSDYAARSGRHYGGSSGANKSGGGAGSYYGDGAAGQGNTMAVGNNGVNGSGASGGRWTFMTYKGGGRGGDAYCRLYWKN